MTIRQILNCLIQRFLILGCLLLLSTASVYGASCWDKFPDLKDCHIKAEQGHAKAQYNLGLIYATGRTTHQDYTAAAKWYKKAAEQGNTKAQYNLGLMYAQGQGVSQDNVMAHMYWSLAARSRDKSAIHNRSVVEKKMTPAQITKAKNLTQAWLKTHNQD